MSRDLKVHWGTLLVGSAAVSVRGDGAGYGVTGRRSKEHLALDIFFGWVWRDAKKANKLVRRQPLVDASASYDQSVLKSSFFETDLTVPVAG